MLGISLLSGSLVMEPAEEYRQQKFEAFLMRNTTSSTPSWATAVIKEEMRRAGGQVLFVPFEDQRGTGRQKFVVEC